MKTSGNKILITGASSGIGFALAQQFMQLGNKVITVDRNVEKQKKAQELLPGLIAIRCDLTLREDIDQLMITIQNQHPDVNVLINNAGIQYNYDFKEEAQPLPRIEKEIHTNVIAPMQLCALLLPILNSHNEAAIVNVSSGLAFAPKADAPVYCATKAAVHNFTKGLRYQLEETNIKVFEIIPSLVATDMTSGRGKGKISPEQLATEFISAFERDRFEVNIGKIKLLRVILRIFPKLAEKMLK